jgi:hypothetical protein
MAEIEQVGDLLIVGGTLAGSAGDQIPADRLQLQNAADLFELFIAGQRTAAEFGYDTFKHGIPSNVLGWMLSHKAPIYIIKRKAGIVKAKVRQRAS